MDNKEDIFEQIYKHYKDGSSFDKMSRLEKLEYANTCMGLVRDYYCEAYGVDKSKIDYGFARMPGGTAGRNIPTLVGDKNEVLKTRTNFEINFALKTTSVEEIFYVAFHEMGHSVDCLKRDDFLEEHIECYDLGINTFSGIGWWGRKDESITDEFCYTNLIKLANMAFSRDNTKENQLYLETLIDEYNKNMDYHQECAKQLQDLKGEIYSNLKTNRIDEDKEKQEQQNEQRSETTFVSADNVFSSISEVKQNNYIFLCKLESEEEKNGNSCDKNGVEYFTSIETIREVSSTPELVDIMNRRDYISEELKDESIPLENDDEQDVQ